MSGVKITVVSRTIKASMRVSEARSNPVIEEIRSCGYATAPVSLPDDQMHELFRNFCELVDTVYADHSDASTDVIQSLSTCLPDRPLDSHGMFERRREGEVSLFDPGGELATENKDILHVVPTTIPQVEAYYRSIGGRMPKLLEKVLRCCQAVQQETLRSIRPIFEALSLDDYMLAPEGQELDNVQILRLVRYLGSTADAPLLPHRPRRMLAELHMDRCKFSTASWESDIGLVGVPAANLASNPALTLEEALAYVAAAANSLIPITPGTMKLFTGAGYSYIDEERKAQSGNLPLFLHGVIDRNATEERYAAVSFINQRLGYVTGIPKGHEKDYGRLIEKLSKLNKKTAHQSQ